MPHVKKDIYGTGTFLPVASPSNQLPLLEEAEASMAQIVMKSEGCPGRVAQLVRVLFPYTQAGFGFSSRSGHMQQSTRECLSK